MVGCLVTGTDTGVGKTVVSAAIAATLAAGGRRVAAFKPVVTGLDEPEGHWLQDHRLLGSVTGLDPEQVAPFRFGPPVSPHLAAREAGVTIEPADLLRSARRAAEGRDVVIVEGVGGLLVPLTPSYSVADFALGLGLPLVVVARPGLGTINHTLLTVEAARARGLDLRAIVLSGWPERPDVVARSNLRTLERLAGLEVAVLPTVSGPDPAALAGAGRGLRPERWLGPSRPATRGGGPLPTAAASSVAV